MIVNVKNVVGVKKINIQATFLYRYIMLTGTIKTTKKRTYSYCARTAIH